MRLTLTDKIHLELVRVPAGEFIMGSEENAPNCSSDELPQYHLNLDEFWIGRYPVTVAQFDGFADATGYRTSAEQEGSGWTWSGPDWKDVPGAFWRKPLGPGSNVVNKSHHPVTLTSWIDATAFCRWASATCNANVRLPTEAEWEKAARGADGRLYPWGSHLPDAQRSNSNMRIRDTTAVGQFSPLGDSPFGCADIVGNVWEWTSSLYQPYPYTPKAESESLSSHERRAVRGGSYRSLDRFLRCACRGSDPPTYRIASGGFRVCVSL